MQASAGTRGGTVRRWMGLGLAVATVATVATAAAAGAPGAASQRQAASSTPVVGPAGDDFFIPPSPLPPGQPGDVIWYRRAKATNPMGTAGLAAVDSWQVLYRSTDALGRPNAISGMILVPKGLDPAKLPIVGFAPGTQGLGDDCAPSRQVLAGLQYESLAIDRLLLRGWAVAMTDYEKLGTPGTHTYMVGRSQGPALLDVVRAARRLPADRLSSTSPVALYGYSQGGSASSWAAELQQKYAPELPVRGIFSGGTPADLTEVTKALDGGVGFGFLVAASIGMDAAYPELKLDSFLNQTGRKKLAEARSLCVAGLLTKYAGNKIKDFTTSNPLTTSPRWKARIDEQKPGRAAPAAPVMLAHGKQDELIPLSQAERLRRDWCAAGARVTWKTYTGGHLTVLAAAQGDALDFLADRLAGKAATSSC
jgi:pimeloyl-ACP methyl ester carboxylesterase